MDIPASNKPLGAGPKTRVCYICGRQYSLHSFGIHIPQCKELWLAREAQKDPKDRKKLPEDPLEKLQGSGGGGLDDTAMSSGVASPGGGGFTQMTRKELDELNKLSNDTFNTETLSACLYCGRTFLPEKLVIHNRSCTADNPARRVTDKVKRGNDLPNITEGITPSRPKTTTSLNPRSRSAAPTPSKESLMGNNTESDDNGTTDLRVSDGALVGHLGGSAGRSIRSKPPMRSQQSSLSPAPATNMEEELAGKGKEEVVALLSNRIEFVESTIFDLSQTIGEMKAMLTKLKDL